MSENLKSSRAKWLAAFLAVLVQFLTLAAPAQDANVMSLVASYQYLDTLGTDTNAQIISPVASYQLWDALGQSSNAVIFSAAISYQFNDSLTHIGSNDCLISLVASYQYFDWPDATSVSFIGCSQVSYYYAFLDELVLPITKTLRLPIEAELIPPGVLPSNSSRLFIFHDGIFSTNLTVADPLQPTVVLTHGWVPLKGSNALFKPYGINSWPLDMAMQLRSNDRFLGNIIAWDWSQAASSSLTAPGIAARQTPEQGIQLGQQLQVTLGSSYSKRIQFIGHSLGTLVNGWAANYLHREPWGEEPFPEISWPPTNTIMTLFDEAEASVSFTGIWSDLDVLLNENGDPLAPRYPYCHPLPKHFKWAENYVSAIGLLHTNAENIILTNKLPSDAPDWGTWINEFVVFHGYPINWYKDTIHMYDMPVGFLWPYYWLLGDDAAFANFSFNTNHVYIQTGSEFNLVQTNWGYGTNLLATRFRDYENGITRSFVVGSVEWIRANGDAYGNLISVPMMAENPATVSELILHLLTDQSANIHGLAYHPNYDNSDLQSQTNTPAYVWMSLVIPPNAVSMSFSYRVQGNWKSDSLVAGFNGTNIFLLPGNTIEMDRVFNSEPIDISSRAGTTNEFFVGIYGGTSTNAELTIENITFFVAQPPSLTASLADNRIVLAWPLSFADYVLEKTADIADQTSWITINDLPRITGFQCIFTNYSDDRNLFFRLRKQ